jgi:dolichol-phosphate mannosyltransferase
MGELDLSIVVPFYNEIENLLVVKNELIPVITELAQNRTVEVVFVDDGSTDGSLDTLKQALRNSDIDGVTVKFTRHDLNRGLGAALRTGFLAARGDILVTTDSDGTYRFSNIPILLSYLTEQVDIVTASPYHPQGGVEGVPAYRLVLSKGSSLIYRLIVNWYIHTYTCLFRAYRRRVVDQISFTSDGFLGGTELLVKSILSGYRVAEYPAILHSRVYGTSKAKLVRTILAHLRFQGRILLHRFHIISILSPNKNDGDLTWARPNPS